MGARVSRARSSAGSLQDAAHGELDWRSRVATFASVPHDAAYGRSVAEWLWIGCGQ